MKLKLKWERSDDSMHAYMQNARVLSVTRWQGVYSAYLFDDWLPISFGTEIEMMEEAENRFCRWLKNANTIMGTFGPELPLWPKDNGEK